MDEYHSIAPYYERILGRALYTIRRDIRTFIHYHGHKRIIDVCCGTGRQLEMLAGPGMELYGIDISAAMIGRADREAAIHFVVADVMEMELPAGHFDAVLATFAFHEKNDLDRDLLLRRCWDLVRPGGHLIIGDYCRIPSSLPGYFWGKLLLPLVERLAGSSHYRNYRSWMQEGALESLLTSLAARRSIISTHFGDTVALYALVKEPYDKQLFLQFDNTIRETVLS